MDKPSPPKTAAVVQIVDTFKAVLWSFLGIRRGADHDADMAKLKPVHVILVGIVCCVAFVLCLIAVVQLVLR